MKYEIKEQFKKDYLNLKDKHLAKVILNTITHISESENIKSIKNLKKLKNCDNAYRIRAGNYRIGVFIEDNIVVFTAFAHRKDIYKQFP
ncbi:toxin RelE [Bacteroidia bacterium]|nr:toxin RelE [Bacteroidia bacterium]GHV21404.1 toxin RelE [Bacteroidia bacterium]